MLSDTVIDAATINAYLETDYHVRTQPPFILRVNESNPALAALQQAHGASCSAFITACNPYSVQLDDARNAACHLALAAELASRRLAYMPGIGQHPSGNWPGEESFLVIGLTLSSAKELGEQFKQNAILWSAADAAPQLILLR